MGTGTLKRLMRKLRNHRMGGEVSCHGLRPGQELRKKVTGKDGLSHANIECFATDFMLYKSLRQGTELYVGLDFQGNAEKFWLHQNTCGECCSYGDYGFCCYPPTVQINGKAESNRQTTQKEDS